MCFGDPSAVTVPGDCHHCHFWQIIGRYMAAADANAQRSGLNETNAWGQARKGGGARASGPGRIASAIEGMGTAPTCTWA
mgnify:FL=1